MPLSDRFQSQVALLIEVLPFVAAETVFALKGGTAINLFVRNMPRLSVDIDLTYLPVAPRPESLSAIDGAMKRMAEATKDGIRDARVNEVVNRAEGIVTKLTVQRSDAQIKVEVTPVLRGCVFEPELRTVSPKVEEAFGFAETQVVSFSDLYAGKIVAARTGSTRATSSTCATCWRTKASVKICAAPLSFTSSAMTVRFQKSLFLGSKTSRRNSSRASME
ncbi:putative nucleotidyltransferase component of viral defense system [Bradyrhizobium sp. AZCC 2289]